MLAKYKFLLPTLFFCFLFFATKVSAQVVINEFLPNPQEGKEWVEFYNNDTTTADLSKYYFDDDNDFNVDGGSKGKAKVLLKGILNTGQTCYWELSLYLNNDGDSPTLFGDNGSIIDTYTYSSSTKGKTYSRVPDGGVWEIDQDPTKSSVSCESLAPTSTPDPTPTPTEAPVDTPAPTPVPTPTKTPTSKPTVKAVATKRPIKLTFDTDSEDSILGLREGLAPSPTGTPEPEAGRKFPWSSLFFILGGIGFMGFAGFSFLKQRKKGYNNGDGDEKKTEGFEKIKQDS